MDHYKTAENYIAKYLKSHGHEILRRNYLDLPHGEVDIISFYNSTFYLTEVKARSTILENEDYLRIFSLEKYKKVYSTGLRFLRGEKQIDREIVLQAALVYWNKEKQITSHTLYPWQFI